jgi:hypothetical protein
VRFPRLAVLPALLLIAGCGARAELAPTPVAATPAPDPTGAAHAERGAAQQPAPAAAAARSDDAAIARMLARRAAALQAGDGAALAATAATAAQKARDRRAAARAGRLPLRSVRIGLVRVRRAGNRARVTARIGYGLPGTRDRYAAVRRMTVRRGASAGAAWRLVREHGTRGRHPWEVADFVAARSAHFRILAATRAQAAALAPALEDAYARMKQRLPPELRLRRRYTAIRAASVADARALTTSISGLERLLALTDVAVRDSDAGARRRVVSLRLLIVGPRFDALDVAGRRRVVTHELTHAALAGITSDRTPAWLQEGVALYVSGDRRVGEAALRRSSHRISRLAKPDAIAELSGPAQQAGYADASAAAYYVSERYGQSGLLDLFAAFDDPRVRGGRGVVDRVLRRELGASLPRFERGLERWIARG